MDTPKMIPYHAMPKAGAYIADAGTASNTKYTQANNSIGGSGFQDEFNIDGLTGTNFRGGTAWAPAASKAYHPIGKGRLNVGYAQHSLKTHATDTVGDEYKVPNSGLVNTFKDLVTNNGATITFGKQIVRNDSAKAYYIPNYDQVCSTCDTISFTTWTSQGKQKAFDPNYAIANGWRIVPSTSSGAKYHVIYGGVDLTGVNGVASGTEFIFLWKAGQSWFNAANGQFVYVVSENGGAAIVPQSGLPIAAPTKP
jgi:hypothetical protein